MEVRMKVKFLDWDKGEKATLPDARAKRYISMGACEPIRSPRKKQTKAAPRDKMVRGAVNK